MIKKRTIVRALLVIIAILFATIALYSWDELEKDSITLKSRPSSPIQVEWFKVIEREITDWIYAEGTARVNRKAHLTFEVDGKVEKLAVIEDVGLIREGIEVEGPDEHGNKQLLAQLRDKDYSEELQIAISNKVRAEKDVDVARAELKQSESRLKLSRLRFTRNRHLASTKTISIEKFDESKSDLDISELAVRSAKARKASAIAALQAATNSLSQATRNLTRTRIYAPWRGCIARVNIEEGEYISIDALDITNSDTMTATFPITIIDRSKFKISVEIPLDRLTKLTPGAPAFVQSQTLSKSNRQATNNWIPAEVFTIAPILSPKSRTVRVRLNTTSDYPPLIDGELIRAKILKENKRALVIPLSAITYIKNEPNVFKVNPKSKIAERITITTGIRDDKNIEVIKGLYEGDTIVTSGRQRLRDGSQVKLLKETK